MKKLLLFLSLILCCVQAQAALTANVVWETRPGAGSDTLCSGGFDSSQTSPGTDYSQQNAAHVVFNGTTITATTNGVTNGLLLTGYTVVGTDVGNVVQVTAGTNFIAGFYTITAVMTGAFNEWELDRNVATGIATAMTGAMGGALASLQTALITNSGRVAVPGNIIWQKGALTVTSAIAFTGGNQLLRISWRGYSVTRGDNIKQAVTTATNSINLISFGNPSGGYDFLNLAFSSTAGTPGTGAFATGNTAFYDLFQNCSFTGFTVAIDGSNLVPFEFNNLVVLNCEIFNNSSFGIQSAGTISVIGSYFHGNTGDDIETDSMFGSPATYVAYNTFSGGSGSGVNDQSIYIGRVLTIIGNNFYNKGADGIRLGTGGSYQAVVSMNNVFWLNAGFGINYQTVATGAAVPSLVAQFSNAFGMNTSGARNTGAPAGTNDIALTAIPWVSVAGSNFALNATAGGGALLFSSGYPGITPMGTGFVAVGALQPAASSGGGQHGYPIVQ